MSWCAVVQPTVTMPTRRVQAMNTVHHVVHDASHRSFMSPPDGVSSTDELQSRNELLRSVGMSSRNPDEARELAHKTIKDVVLCTPWHRVSFRFDPVLTSRSPQTSRSCFSLASVPFLLPRLAVGATVACCC